MKMMMRMAGKVKAVVMMIMMRIMRIRSREMERLRIGVWKTVQTQEVVASGISWERILMINT